LIRSLFVTYRYYCCL